MASIYSTWWFWLLLISILLLIIFVVAYIIYGQNNSSEASTPTWVWLILALAVIIFIIAVMLYAFSIYERNKCADPCKPVEVCKPKDPCAKINVNACGTKVNECPITHYKVMSTGTYRLVSNPNMVGTVCHKSC